MEWFRTRAEVYGFGPLPSHRNAVAQRNASQRLARRYAIGAALRSCEASEQLIP